MDNPPSQARILWCDAEANCHRLASRSGVADVVRKAKRANINTLAVDVKPLGGEVLYTSRYAPRLGIVDGRNYPESFDLLATTIEEGHSQGIRIHAAINMFSEGHREWARGPAYEHPEWQVTMYETIRTIEFPSTSITVEVADPWESSDVPAVYTRKSGKVLQTEPGRRYITIQGSCVTCVAGESGVEISVPQDGSILSLPASVSAAEVSPGDTVKWHSEPIFRSAEQSKMPSWGIFVNPIGPARNYELRIIEEIVSEYDIDGIVFDRMRYPNLYADFSDAGRESFEKWLGRGLLRWPEDVFVINDVPWLPPVPGRYYKEWLEWRALQIRNFAEEAVQVVHAAKSDVKVGVYVGSWYESYYDVGVNWGSRDFHAGYPWMTPGYNRTGFAELFDYVCTGCYYPIPTREEARALGRPEGATVEAACRLSCEAIGNATHVYGSLYLRDYGGNPEGFRRAIEVVLEHMDGIMLFDLVHVDDCGWWPTVGEKLAIEAVAPHDLLR